MTEILPRETVLMRHISGNALALPCEYHGFHTVALRGSCKKKGFLHNYSQSAPGFIHLFPYFSCGKINRKSKYVMQ